MKILVPFKRVPDPDTRIRVKPDGSALDLDGVKFAVNPFDAIALEQRPYPPASALEHSFTSRSSGNHRMPIVH